MYEFRVRTMQPGFRKILRLRLLALDTCLSRRVLHSNCRFIKFNTFVWHPPATIPWHTFLIMTSHRFCFQWALERWRTKIFAMFFATAVRIHAIHLASTKFRHGYTANFLAMHFLFLLSIECCKHIGVDHPRSFISSCINFRLVVVSSFRACRLLSPSLWMSPTEIESWLIPKSYLDK